MIQFTGAMERAMKAKGKTKAKDNIIKQKPSANQGTKRSGQVAQGSGEDEVFLNHYYNYINIELNCFLIREVMGKKARKMLLQKAWSDMSEEELLLSH